MADTAHNAEVEELRLESLLSNLKAIDAIFCILECFKLRKNIPWRDQLSESRYLPACVLNRGVKFDNNSYCVHRN